MSHGKIVTTIRVDLSPRPDHLLAMSDDLPGLNVCASSMEQACERIPAAIKLLYKLNRGIDVEVYHATDKAALSRPNAVTYCAVC